MPASQILDHLETKFTPQTPYHDLNTSPQHSSIHLLHRHERSAGTHMVHLLTKPLRSQFGRPKKKYPHGSPSLKPTKVIHKTCSISERTVCDIHIYDVVPRKQKKEGVSAFTKRIYYFCGGGWQSPASPQHWQLVAKLARSVPETCVSLVSYPLAPANAAPVCFPWLMRLYREVMREAEEEGHKVIFAGDSSGANLVLGLVLEALREDEEKRKSIEEGGPEGMEQQMTSAHPVALLVISPSTDLTRSNPEIEKLKNVDPLLTPEFIKETAKAWLGDWDATDRRVSPIFADISLLAKAAIQVHGVTGGFDILAPDAVMFRNNCQEEGVKGEWLEWEKQMHCFPLTWCYGLREGRESVGWITDVLRKE